MKCYFLVAKVDFDPEKGKKQQVKILVGPDQELLSSDSLADAKKKSENLFGEELEIGKTFYETPNERFYFANLQGLSEKKLPDGWQLLDFLDLDHKNDEFEVIKKSILSLGYEI